MNSRGSTVDELTPISPSSVPRDQLFTESYMWKIALVIYLCISVVMAVLLLHTSFSSTVLLLVGAATMISYLFACLELAKMFKPEEDSRIFRVPFSPFLPLIGVFVNTYMLVGLPMLALVRAACVFGVCTLFYYVKVSNPIKLVDPPPANAANYDSMDSSPRLSN